MKSPGCLRSLDARAQYPTSTLADLYDPLTMPAPLLKAHQQLDWPQATQGYTRATPKPRPKATQDRPVHRPVHP
jgi:hypothetical protein